MKWIPCVCLCAVTFVCAFSLGAIAGREEAELKWRQKLIEGQHGYYHPENGRFQLRQLQVMRVPRGLDV